MTYPGGQPDPQQPYQQQPYGGQPQPYQPQPPQAYPPQAYQPQPQVPQYDQTGMYQAQPYGPTGYAPPAPAPEGQQKGLKWALLGVGSFLALMLLIVGGYYTYQRVFVHTPTQVVQDYLDEATKAKPDPHKLEQYLCKEEADKLEKAVANDPNTDSGTSVLSAHTTGETIDGNTATVFTEFTVKDDNSRTSTRTLNFTLIKESREWKICGFGV